MKRLNKKASKPVKTIKEAKEVLEKNSPDIEKMKKAFGDKIGKLLWKF